MSEFLFIIPDGWTRVDLDNLASLGTTVEMVASYIQDSTLNALNEALQGFGIITVDQRIIEAKLFNNEVFIIKLG